MPIGAISGAEAGPAPPGHGAPCLLSPAVTPGVLCLSFPSIGSLSPFPVPSPPSRIQVAPWPSNTSLGLMEGSSVLGWAPFCTGVRPLPTSQGPVPGSAGGAEVLGPAAYDLGAGRRGPRVHRGRLPHADQLQSLQPVHEVRTWPAFLPPPPPLTPFPHPAWPTKSLLSLASSREPSGFCQEGPGHLGSLPIAGLQWCPTDLLHPVPQFLCFSENVRAVRHESARGFAGK